MTANLIPLAFEDHLVRVVKPNGEPWFVGKDVCDVLELSKHHQALDRLDPDERGTCTVGTPGGDQEVIIVSEPGVFRLIFTSRKPEAERFKRWLAHEVLPTLRRTGTFTLPRVDAQLEFPGADGPLTEHLAKIATLRECRLIHGARAAARLWRRLGMPAVEESVEYQADDGRACLARLLAEPIEFGGGHEPIAGIVELALGGNDIAGLALKAYGIATIEHGDEGIVVSNTHARLAEIFAATPWARGVWRTALRRLTGAQPRRVNIAGVQSRGTFLPAALVDLVPPAPAAAAAGANVVPMIR